MKASLQIYRRLWRNRDLRIALIARSVSEFGDDLALVALLLRVHDEGGGPLGVAALLIASTLPIVVLAPWAGRLADSKDSRLLIVVSAGWQVVACLALALPLPMPAVLALVVLLQAGHAVGSPTWQALVPRLAPDEQTGPAIGAMQAMTTVAGVAGPAVGGLLLAEFGAAVPMLVDAVTFLGLAIAGLAIRTRRMADPADRDTELSGSLLTGLRTLRNDRLLWPLLLGVLAFIVVGETTNVVEVFFVRDTLGGSAFAFGVIGALLAAGLVVGSLAAGHARDDGSRTRYVLAGAAGISVALALASLSPNVVVFGLCFALLGPLNGLANASASTLLVVRSPDAVRGQVLAAATALTRGCGIGALLVGGVVAALASPRVIFLVAGVCGLLVTLVMYVRLRGELEPSTVDSVTASP